MDCRRVDVGVMGERKEMTSSSGTLDLAEGGAGMRYVRFVVEASKVAPTYSQNEMLKLPKVSGNSSKTDRFCCYPD